MLVTIFTGFLGAGKTTILQHVRQQLTEDYPNEKVLTIVNDVSDVNVDQYAFASIDIGADQSHAPTPQAPGVSALSGGCVCCNLLGELVQELLRAYDEGYGYVFLECTGVADPVPVVATLAALPALSGKVTIDAVITVLHARSMWSATRCAGAETESPSYVLDVSAVDPLKGSQACGANVVLINNWEAVEAVNTDVLSAWKSALRGFLVDSNPSVRVFFTNNGGRFAFSDLVFHQDLFTSDGVLPFFLRAYADSRKAVGDLGDAAEEAGELDTIGLRAFTFESTTAVLSIAALQTALATRQGKALLRGVWRSKGFFSAVDDTPEARLSGGAASSPRQFRWQTVGRQFDFGEVLPPYVPLWSEDKRHGTAAQPLTCQIVFIGELADVVDEKQQQVRRFFDHITL